MPKPKHRNFIVFVSRFSPQRKLIVEHHRHTIISPSQAEHLINTIGGPQQVEKKPFVIPQISSSQNVVQVDESFGIDSEFFINMNELTEDLAWEF